MSGAWTAADLADQSGKTVIVTGANSGLGQVTASELARVGAHVILACRNTDAGAKAAAEMTGDVEVRALDLADLESVQAFASSVDQPIDILINNAGVMATPQKKTAQGFELQFGTNHLGHFALTGLLLDRLRQAPSPRVTVLSSAAHRIGKLNFDDLQSEQKYSRWSAYGQSKLANLMFAYEFARRAKAAGSPITVTAAHPGYASTKLQSKTESFMDRVMAVGNALLAQSAEAGAWPTLYAATMDIPSGSYVGPDGFQQQRGKPKLVGSTAASRDEAAAKRLWEVSEELTGVRFNL
ncbi:MAG TPA: oxidoreductase [Candidatus Limnocylindria bacterium]|nr:oxidoreductase [Candidatus Limnocylindria bacterium]